MDFNYVESIRKLSTLLHATGRMMEEGMHQSKTKRIASLASKVLKNGLALWRYGRERAKELCSQVDLCDPWGRITER